MDVFRKFQIKHPLYPLLCLASSALLLLCGLLLAGRQFFPLFLLEVCLLYIAFGYGSALLRSMAVIVPLSVFFFLLSCVVNRSSDTAFVMASRVFMMGLCIVPSLGMTQIRLIRNLNQVHCPRMLTVGILIAVRFVPVVALEVRQIRAAMKTRGVRASLFNVRCFYRALLIPLLMRLISISDTLAMSMETRGFEMASVPYTVYRRVDFTPKDAVYTAVLLVLLTANFLLLP